MSTTVFITPYFENNPFKWWAKRAAASVVMTFCCLMAPSAFAAELNQLKVERAEDGIYLSALASFDIPPAVEDALMKGIPLFFVAEAEFFQSRWYWTDRRTSGTTRTIRLAFQPLTRRWRTNVYSGAANTGNAASSAIGLRSTLSQNYDSLSDALSGMQRFSRWKIAESADIDPDVTYRFEFRFNLDLAQLPRPFQIGVVGQKDWTIAIAVDERMQIGPYRPAPAASEKQKAATQ